MAEAKFLQKTEKTTEILFAEKIGYAKGKGFMFTIVNTIDGYDFTTLAQKNVQISGLGNDDDFVVIGGHATKGTDPKKIPVGERFKIVVRTVNNQIILK